MKRNKQTQTGRCFLYRPFVCLFQNKEIGRRKMRLVGMDWVNLTQSKGPLAGTCKNGNEPSGSIKYWKIPE
jgi:hypothetical protein